MNGFERLGFRRGPNPDTGKIDWWHGLFPGETREELAIWLRKLRAFFEQKPSKETKEGAAA